MRVHHPRPLPLLIGQAPGRGAGAALAGRAGTFLERVAGLQAGTLGQHFDRINVLRDFPGKAGPGDAFPIDRARRATYTRRILEPVVAAPIVVLLGRNVARAFRADYPPLRWFNLNGTPAIIVPHPSGLNRWWNDRRRRKRAGQVLAAIASGHVVISQTGRTLA